MSELTIEVQERDATGKGANRRLRASGRVPAVVYGGGKDSLAITVEARRLQDLLRESGSEHAVFLLKLGDTGKSRHTMIREMAVDPLTHAIVHVDFQRVSLKEKVRVSVPVEFVGTPVGVKLEDGILEFLHREVEIECLPGQIPHALDLDVSGLHVGQSLAVGDLPAVDGVTVLEAADRTLVAVGHARVSEAAEGEEAAEERELEEPEIVGRRQAVESEDEGEGEG